MATNYSEEEIHRQFIRALEGVVEDHTPLDEVPLEAQLAPPLPPKLRVYAYNVTTPPGSGPNGEHIARLILPDQGPGDRASFDYSGGYMIVLVGYAVQSDVFILWDAGLHRNFLYGKEVRVNPGPVFEAVGGDIGTQKRYLKTGTETVLTAGPSRLKDAIEQRSALTTERLTD